MMLIPTLCLCSVAIASPPPKHTPEALLSSFYTWYLKEFENYKSPIFDDKKALGTYVSSSAIKRIAKGYAKDAYDSDYFTKSQDIMPDWHSHISVSDVEINGQKASAIVTLGNANPWKLNVFMSIVGSEWRIEKVVDLNR